MFTKDWLTEDVADEAVEAGREAAEDAGVSGRRFLRVYRRVVVVVGVLLRRTVEVAGALMLLRQILRQPKLLC